MPQAGSAASKARIAKMKSRSYDPPDTNLDNPTRTITSASGQVLKQGSPEALSYGQTDKTAINTSQPSPKTTDVGKGLPGAPTQDVVPYESALSNLQKSGMPQADIARATETLKQKYGQAKTQMDTAGVSTQDMGEGMGAVGQHIGEVTPKPPEVDTFYAENPYVQQSVKDMMEFLNPQSTRDALTEMMSQYHADRKELSNLRTELMDVERIMDGTDQDIRDEIEKAGGFGTESQVRALTIGRNQELLKQSALIKDQMSIMQDAIQTDVTMFGMAQQVASQQFQQRSFLLNYQMQVEDRIYRANQDAVKNQLSLLGADGLYSATQGDPVKIGRIEQTLGIPKGSLAIAAKTAAETRATQARMEALDIAVKESTLYTNKLNQEKLLQEIESGKPLDVSKLGIDENTPTEDKNNIVLNALLGSSKISAGTKTQLANTLGVVNALQDMATQRQTTGFKGISPFNALLDLKIPFTEVGVIPFRKSLTSKEGLENRQYLEAVNLKVQQWASGASLTKQQTEQVDRFTPRPTDRDSAVRTKTNGLVNFMLTQIASQLQAEGVEFIPEKVNLFETYELLQQASPEQKEELRAQGLIQ